jgi:dihydroneopterin aldolase
VSDRILLDNMIFQGKHGLLEAERNETQPFEVDVELHLDLSRAGMTDDIAETVDYRTVFDICRRVVENTSCHLLEALAETLAAELVARVDADEIVVRIRKPYVALPGEIESSGVEIVRSRA